MKILLTAVVALLFCLQVEGQVSSRTTPRTKTATSKAIGTNRSNQTASGQTEVNLPVQSRMPGPATQTITERRLNGPAGSNTNTSSSENTTGTEKPFVGGVHAAGNAGRSFDSSASNSNALNRNRVGGSVIAGGNDTTFNVNTMEQNSVNTTSGAVDRSGQAQFGQTNWGRNVRNTVGESQWTVPPPITSSFNREFPAANSATWTRNNVDTTIYSARYKSGENWVTSRYNAAGQRMDTRFEIPLVQAPRPVSVFLARQPANFSVTSISRLQIQGRPEVYEIVTATGKTVYVNNDGMEVGL